jgi:predicted S18 family serine protease
VNNTYSAPTVLSTTVYAIGVYEHSDEGDLILINITLVPGDGKIFVNVKDIEAGVTFQDYLKTVWDFVNTYTYGKLNHYDVYVHIQGNAEVVEGGSGSVMIALGMISLLENKSLNKDFIVSGVLDNKGRIGTVLSLREKVKLARKFGFERFYVAEEEYESVKDIPGIKVIPVKYISEIIHKELK